MESQIEVRKDGTVSCYSGPDATNLFRARLLVSSLRMFASCGMLPTRGVSGKMMLAMAGEYTGKKYKRGQASVAADDVAVWCDTMVAALPIVER